jgi:hypothetical protein
VYIAKTSLNIPTTGVVELPTTGVVELGGYAVEEIQEGQMIEPYGGDLGFAPVTSEQRFYFRRVEGKGSSAVGFNGFRLRQLFTLSADGKYRPEGTKQELTTLTGGIGFLFNTSVDKNEINSRVVKMRVPKSQLEYFMHFATRYIPPGGEILVEYNPKLYGQLQDHASWQLCPAKGDAYWVTLKLGQDFYEAILVWVIYFDRVQNVVFGWFAQTSVKWGDVYRCRVNGITQVDLNEVSRYRKTEGSASLQMSNDSSTWPNWIIIPSNSRLLDILALRASRFFVNWRNTNRGTEHSILSDRLQSLRHPETTPWLWNLVILFSLALNAQERDGIIGEDEFSNTSSPWTLVKTMLKRIHQQLTDPFAKPILWTYNEEIDPLTFLRLLAHCPECHFFHLSDIDDVIKIGNGDYAFILCPGSVSLCQTQANDTDIYIPWALMEPTEEGRLMFPARTQERCITGFRDLSGRLDPNGCVEKNAIVLLRKIPIAQAPSSCGALVCYPYILPLSPMSFRELRKRGTQPLSQVTLKLPTLANHRKNHEKLLLLVKESFNKPLIEVHDKSGKPLRSQSSHRQKIPKLNQEHGEAIIEVECTKSTGTVVNSIDLMSPVRDPSSLMHRAKTIIRLENLGVTVNPEGVTGESDAYGSADTCSANQVCDEPTGSPACGKNKGDAAVADVFSPPSSPPANEVKSPGAELPLADTSEGLGSGGFRKSRQITAQGGGGSGASASANLASPPSSPPVNEVKSAPHVPASGPGDNAGNAASTGDNTATGLPAGKPKANLPRNSQQSRSQSQGTVTQNRVCIYTAGKAVGDSGAELQRNVRSRRSRRIAAKRPRSPEADRTVDVASAEGQNATGSPAAATDTCSVNQICDEATGSPACGKSKGDAAVADVGVESTLTNVVCMSPTTPSDDEDLDCFVNDLASPPSSPPANEVKSPGAELPLADPSTFEGEPDGLGSGILAAQGGGGSGASPSANLASPPSSPPLNEVKSAPHVPASGPGDDAASTGDNIATGLSAGKPKANLPQNSQPSQQRRSSRIAAQEGNGSAKRPRTPEADRAVNVASTGGQNATGSPAAAADLKAVANVDDQANPAKRRRIQEAAPAADIETTAYAPDADDQMASEGSLKHPTIFPQDPTFAPLNQQLSSTAPDGTHLSERLLELQIMVCTNLLGGSGTMYSKKRNQWPKWSVLESRMWMFKCMWMFRSSCGSWSLSRQPPLLFVNKESMPWQTRQGSGGFITENLHELAVTGDGSCCARALACSFQLAAQTMRNRRPNYLPPDITQGKPEAFVAVISNAWALLTIACELTEEEFNAIEDWPWPGRQMIELLRTFLLCPVVAATWFDNETKNITWGNFTTAENVAGRCIDFQKTKATYWNILDIVVFAVAVRHDIHLKNLPKASGDITCVRDFFHTASTNDNYSENARTAATKLRNLVPVTEDRCCFIHLALVNIHGGAGTDPNGKSPLNHWIPLISPDMWQLLKHGRKPKTHKLELGEDKFEEQECVELVPDHLRFLSQKVPLRVRGVHSLMIEGGAIRGVQDDDSYIVDIAAGATSVGVNATPDDFFASLCLRWRVFCVEVPCKRFLNFLELQTAVRRHQSGYLGTCVIGASHDGRDILASDSNYLRRIHIIRGAELFLRPFSNCTWTVNHARTIMELTEKISRSSMKLPSDGHWWRDTLVEFMDDRTQIEDQVNYFFDQYGANTETPRLETVFKIFQTDVLVNVGNVPVSRASFYRLQRVGDLQVDLA